MRNDREHPHFAGNYANLEAFLCLADSKIRSPNRERALEEWEQYKLKRQFKFGHPPKGPHMRALIARVIDLNGADLDGICIGYAVNLANLFHAHS